MKIRSVIISALFIMVLLYGAYILWAILAFGGGCNRMAPETHFLPDGYTGKVYIFFNQSEGRAREYDENARVYRIPKSGVLRTKFKSNSGTIDARKDLNFYYQKPDTLLELKQYVFARADSTLNLDSNTVVVFGYRIGRDWFGFGKEGEKLRSTTYIVDSLKNVNKRDYKLTIERFENWDH
ncbi:hypothetical protein [Phaeodactylibacter sp.]|uniref:DUF6843 domain-containing protein n=1 Tax=Phaeodactylibacter sp. TaxID=1940289 RepID=UPI0025F45A9D|nr:hypothetical protein [Phaeodactylibacter sp.]MCI4647399.1 hypothetical protein [Phaeodactylibacter sp.]MCI5090015.1 hypothetical protein [Phaeodactylibacter sp.]